MGLVGRYFSLRVVLAVIHLPVHTRSRKVEMRASVRALSVSSLVRRRHLHTSISVTWRIEATHETSRFLNGPLDGYSKDPLILLVKHYDWTEVLLIQGRATVHRDRGQFFTNQ